MKRIKACFYINGEMDHHVTWGEAFSKGLQQHDIDVALLPFDVSTKDIPSADFHAFWSVKAKNVIAHCRKKHVPFVCLERGYTQDRFAVASINLNGLNGRSQLDVSEFSNNSERRQSHNWHPMESRNPGNKIYLIGQVNGDMALEGQNIYRWSQDIYRQFKARTDLEIFFLPHPLAEDSPPPRFPVPIFKGTLKDAFQDANCIVTYSSNAGTDAWFGGVRACAASPVSMIYAQQNSAGQCTEIEAWANRLSFRQYDLDEVSSGMAWDILKGRILSHPPQPYVAKIAALQDLIL